MDPVVIRRGRYMPPRGPGYSITIKPESRRLHRYPDGPVWQPIARTSGVHV